MIECLCDDEGSTKITCDNDTGHCSCRPNVEGNRCDSCSTGFFKFPGCEGEFRFQTGIFTIEWYLGYHLLLLVLMYSVLQSLNNINFYSLLVWRGRIKWQRLWWVRWKMWVQRQCSWWQMHSMCWWNIQVSWMWRYNI